MICFARIERNDGGDTVGNADAATLAFGTPDERFAILEDQRSFDSLSAIFDFDPFVVVVHRTVLQNLDEGQSLVLVGAAQGVLQMCGVDVDGARDKGRARTQREAYWIDGVVDRAIRRRLGFHPDQRGG